MRYGFILVLVLLSGCMPPPPGRLSTPSGKPEVSLSEPLQSLKLRIVKHLANQGKVIAYPDEMRVIASYTGEDPKLIYGWGKYLVEDHYSFLSLDAERTKVFMSRRWIGDNYSGVFRTEQDQYDEMQASLIALARK
jgi:hypothetical protein